MNRQAIEQMLARSLCLFGLHSWNYWQSGGRAYVYFNKRCDRCDKNVYLGSRRGRFGLPSKGES